MANVTLYLPDDVLAKARAAAQADHRSLSQWLTLQLHAGLGRATAEADLVAMRARHAREVDLEGLTGAIAGAVERGPQGRLSRQPRRGK